MRLVTATSCLSLPAIGDHRRRLHHRQHARLEVSFADVSCGRRLSRKSTEESESRVQQGGGGASGDDLIADRVQGGGGASGDDLIADRVPDPCLLRRVDDVELGRLVELQPDPGVLLGARDVPGGLEVAPPWGLAGHGVLAGHLDPEEGVVGAVDVHVETEGDVVVMDDTDHVLGEEGAVHVLVLPDLAHVGVGCAFHHEDPAEPNLPQSLHRELARLPD